MCIGYFDASGKPHDPNAIVVAGFLSTERKWAKFREDWAALLDEFKIDGPFHTTDYAAGVGQYERFRADPTLRARFEPAAISLIKRRTRMPISVGILLSDYRGVVSEFAVPDEHLVNGYTFAAMLVAYWAIHWQLKHSVPTLDLVYEREEGLGEFRSVFRDLLRNEPQIRPKADHMEFEAADILAWRHGRNLRKHATQQYDAHQFFTDIHDQLPQHLCRYLDAPTLRKRFTEFGYVRR